MARPNRVFFLCSESNGLRRNYTSHLQFLDTIVEAMVSGFGPFPLVSINVVDNVATVDLGEPVTIHPGVKIDIQGTGVPEIDGLQEVDSISGNTLTFKVESSNSSFNNGLTFSYPSMGWSLLFRSSNKLVFRCGSSQGRDDCVMMRYEYVQGGSGALIFYKVKNPTSVDDYEEMSPLLNGPERRLCLLVHTVTTHTLAEKKYDYYFYGDDSFVLVGFNYQVGSPGSEQYEYRYQFSSAAFGVTSKSPMDNGGFILAGTYHYTWYTELSYYCSAFLWGNHGIGILSEAHVVAITEYGRDKDNFVIPAGLRGNGFVFDCSGNPNNSPYQKVNPANNYFNVSIIGGTDFRHYGFFPGLYWSFSAPPMDRVAPGVGIAFKVKATGELAGRHVVAMYSSRAGGPIDHKMSYLRTSSASHLLDLTGPIR